MIHPDDLKECARIVAEPLPFWQCSWCKSFYNRDGYISAPNIPANEISHGVCPACARKIIDNLKAKKDLAQSASLPQSLEHWFQTPTRHIGL